MLFPEWKKLFSLDYLASIPDHTVPIPANSEYNKLSLYKRLNKCRFYKMNNLKGIKE